jgi:hypothetical protein
MDPEDQGEQDGDGWQRSGLHGNDLALDSSTPQLIFKLIVFP